MDRETRIAGVRRKSGDQYIPQNPRAMGNTPQRQCPLAAAYSSQNAKSLNRFYTKYNMPRGGSL
ncbi:MAG: hypothetical protein R2788_23440 [Saprospiraceae bacterium]